ncbi:MAG: hypothetical protein IT562_10795 [Alphaproteobacteria bacterium]|nr:hypothetical protein [Alphaproteobacteria bacterium]
MPDDDAGRDDTALMCQHLAALPGDPRQRIASWIELRAPWLSVAEAKAVTIDAIANPRRWRADTLAWRLRLTAADRATLRITTIGAIDQGRTARETARRAKARVRMEKLRRTKGAKARADYEGASANHAKQWIACGMSRATWYRQGRPAPP